MKGTFAVMADNWFLGLASVLEHAGHFRLLCKGGRVCLDSRSMSDGAKGVGRGCDGKKDGPCE